MSWKTTTLKGVALAGVLGLLAACAGTPAATNSPNTPAPEQSQTDTAPPAVEAAKEITILSGWQIGDATGDFLTKAVEKFQAASGIKVNVETVKFDDVRTTFETAALANQLPDLVTSNFVPEVKPWLTQGLIADTTGFLKDWGITDILQDGVLDPSWTYEGMLGGFPYQVGSWPMWYNMELLKAAGVNEVPKTIDELKAAVTALKANGVQGVCFPGADWGGAGFLWLWAQLYTGPSISDVMANGGWADNPKAMQALKLVGELRDEGVFIENAAGYGYDDCANAYDQGKVGIAHFGSWGFTQLSDATTNATQIAGLPLPEGAGYTRPIAFQTGGNGLMISKPAADDPARLAAVEQFIKFIYTPEILQIWISDSSQLSPVKSDVTGPSTTANVLLQQSGTLFEVNEPAVLHDLYVKVGVDITAEVTWFIGTKGATAEEFASRLDKLWANA